ncbi:MAG: hypothetical protein H6891_11450 [Brucellaceae bacterium]|nr:hypothetical protein [Brucellaceae bacterium]
MRAGVTIVTPNRKYTANANPAVVGVEYADTYIYPSAAVKLKITDNSVRRYSRPALRRQRDGAAYCRRFGTRSARSTGSFTVAEEVSATCAAFFQHHRMTRGSRQHYLEIFDYSFWPVAVLTDQPGQSGLRIASRIGYENSGTLRAWLLYRSGTDHAATGSALGGSSSAFG